MRKISIIPSSIVPVQATLIDDFGLKPIVAGSGGATSCNQLMNNLCHYFADAGKEISSVTAQSTLQMIEPSRFACLTIQN